MCGKKFVVTWFVCIASIALPAFSQSKTGNDVFVRAEYRGFVTTRQRLASAGSLPQTKPHIVRNPP
ncbi:MAG: hypothetical protein DMG12_13235 [Acidobacteria bacterium]|nr:MAG: hypothetical protein DMG12_13235 [Acidobacteriota bacterium]